jgi:DNA-binding SARP family transcriptional activator
VNQPEIHGIFPGVVEREASRPLTVIRRKLAVPALPEQFVERPRVDELLSRLLRDRRLVLVSATAGSGKTTALVAALRQHPDEVAWLTVDRTDAAPGRLVTYLEAALAERRPAVAGTVTAALAAGVPHAEAAGMLVDAVGDEPLVLVLDDLERLEDEADAWAVLEAVVRYAPPQLRLVLLSRRDIPARVREPQPVGSVAVLRETHLAFTNDEAQAALEKLGTEDIDAVAAVEATGGWVTGVLFESWRSTEHVAGAGGEADPLYGYLSSHILGQLAPDDREFLIAVSLLDEVTAAGAAALGLPDAYDHLEALRAAHLPVSWDDHGQVMRCHSRFREYLLGQLGRRAGDEIAALRIAHGRLLAGRGHHEDAVDEFLRAGALAEAKAAAEAAVLPVIERLDFAVAERWLSSLSTLGPHGASPLSTAELMLALAHDDIARGARVADQLRDLGEREELALASEHAAGLMAWCYLHVARLDDVAAVLAAAAPGPTTHAVRWAMRAVTDVPGEPVTEAPQYTSGPLDALIGAADYFLGRFTGLTETPASRWMEIVVLPWRIGALRATGRIEQALELYRAAVDSGRALPGLAVFLGPEVLIDAGRRDEAVAALAEGSRLAARSGSLALQGHVGLVAAKLALNIDRDPVAAQAALERPECRQARSAFAFVEEVAETRLGHALLLEGRDEQALSHLRRAVHGMVAGGRGLELPTAAVLLAEAEWRAGHEAEADHAADVALQAAARQGSNHLLLQALGEFPAVLSRRLDAEPSGDSQWHELGRALLAQGAQPAAAIGAPIVLREFGRVAIEVDGEPVHAKIAKSYGLLAYLVATGGGPAERDVLLDALFDSRSDDSARAYLRQAVRHLRDCLPGRSGLEVDAHTVRLADGIVVTSDSVRFEQRLAEASGLQGAARLRATLAALRIVDGGDYLPRVRAVWVDERRQSLEQQATDARYEAAELAFSLGDIERAQMLADQVLEVDRFRESAWRLKMRLANALGHEDHVIGAFRGCEEALAELGAAPSTATRRLLDALRR